jgi:hypothetical protein
VASDATATPPVASASGQTAAPAEERVQPFTIVVLPDTQYYCAIREPSAERRWGRDCREYFPAQTRWIVASRDRLNTVFVVHEGDVTELDYDPEWELAAEAMGELDGVVPYALCVGNHDLGCVPRAFAPRGRWKTAANRHSHFAQYFPRGKYTGEPWFGGSMDNTLVNAYYTFAAAGMPFLIISLEFKPRDEALEWADRVVTAHPDHRVIVLTHAYLNNERRGQKRLERGMDGYDVEGNNGEQMWDRFVSQHANIFMVLCGHVGGAGRDEAEGRLDSTGRHGNTVYQLLSDYQFWDKGGEGWLRYLTFHPADDRIEVYTYNPVTDRFLDEKISRFTLPYPMRGSEGRRTVGASRPLSRSASTRTGSLIR